MRNSQFLVAAIACLLVASCWAQETPADNASPTSVAEPVESSPSPADADKASEAPPSPPAAEATTAAGNPSSPPPAEETTPGKSAEKVSSSPSTVPPLLHTHSTDDTMSQPTNTTEKPKDNGGSYLTSSFALLLMSVLAINLYQS